MQDTVSRRVQMRQQRAVIVVADNISRYADKCLRHAIAFEQRTGECDGPCCFQCMRFAVRLMVSSGLTVKRSVIMNCSTVLLLSIQTDDAGISARGQSCNGFPVS